VLSLVSSLCLLCRKDRERDPRDRERDSYRSVTTFAEKKDYRPDVKVEYVDDFGRMLDPKEVETHVCKHTHKILPAHTACKHTVLTQTAKKTSFLSRQSCQHSEMLATIRRQEEPVLAESILGSTP